MRHRWRDGTREIVFAPQDLLQRLVPLIPAPGAHLVTYHGVLAPCASWRERVVPGGLPPRRAARMARCGHAPAMAARAEAREPSPVTAPEGILKSPGSRPKEGEAAAAASPPAARPEIDGGTCVAGAPAMLRRYAWADLMRRVFACEVLECPDCGGRLRILAAIHPPDTTRAILECLGLPSRAPPVAPASHEPGTLDW